MSTEWTIPETEIPVRQGDLLICRNVRTGDISDICLVITADCDIRNGKFGREIACLRVTPLHGYLRNVWAKKKLARFQSNQIKLVREQMAKWHSLQIGTPSGLTDEATLSWVQRATADEICADLNVPIDQKKNISKAIQLLKSGLSASETPNLQDCMSRLALFKACTSEKPIDICQQDILKDAQKEELPDDFFLFTSLPQIETGPAVVHLRELFGVDAKAIRYRATDADSDECFLRVGRLEPTFKYAVSQAFGSLYSKIGLPNEYEVRRDNALKFIQTYQWEQA